MIVISSKPGQLGNQLFLFTHVLAFCIEHDLPVINISFDYSYLFPSLLEKLNRLNKKNSIRNGVIAQMWLLMAKAIRKLSISSKLFAYTNLAWTETKNLDILEPKNLAALHFFFGWQYRCPKLTSKHKKVLLQTFEFSASCKNSVQRFEDELRINYQELIGVHIRQGDYATFEGGKYYYQNETYENWITELSQDNPNSAIVLFSNNPNMEDLNQQGNVFQGRGAIDEDMLMMSRCNHIIGPPSTFSLWASFIGNKPILQLVSAQQEVKISECKIPSTY